MQHNRLTFVGRFFILRKLTFKIYSTVTSLPELWDEVAHSNIFLQKHYLKVLEDSAPTNMECFYIGIYEDQNLIGVALAQYLDVNKLESFGERDKCIKTFVRNFIFKQFASHTLFLGNNMITGQNGYAFIKDIDFAELSEILLQSAHEIIAYFNNKKIKIHVVTFKDFYEKCAKELKNEAFKDLHEFNTQPNMILYLDENWKSETDYINALSKKYRDQYKRARKKADSIVVKNLSVLEIENLENELNSLYHYVAQNAPFNTFFLSENHFLTMKKQCLDHFLLFGYFKEDKLVGFHTVILNGTVLETYFLGYDATIQKENMLYLNMLYNMTAYGIENGFEKIIFGRTALEIKSGIGAKAVTMSGFIMHTNRFINKNIGFFFNKLEPKTNWIERNPFK